MIIAIAPHLAIELFGRGSVEDARRSGAADTAGTGHTRRDRFREPQPGYLQ
jgi:hypothetical protein